MLLQPLHGKSRNFNLFQQLQKLNKVTPSFSSLLDTPVADSFSSQGSLNTARKNKLQEIPTPAPLAKWKLSLLSQQAIDAMDTEIRKNSVSPKLTNINPNSWYERPKLATVLSNERVSFKPEIGYEVRQIQLKTPFAKGLKPGQHLFIAPKNLKLGTLDTSYRRYSIAGISPQEDIITVVYRRLPSGPVSDAVLTQAKAGDKIEVQGPDWNGFLLPPRSAPMLVFSTGIATIAPVQFMLKTRLAQQQPHAKNPGETRLYATYASPAHEIPGSHEEFETWEQNKTYRFQLNHAYSSETKTKPLRRYNNDPEAQQRLANILDKLSPVERKRTERLFQQLGKTPEQRLDTLNLLLRPDSTLYACGFLEIEKTIASALQCLGAEHNQLEALNQRIATMKSPQNSQWRIEGINKI
jgi:ferredoxin-NADP reductase